jgi:putative ABC transport system permease protein
MRTILTVLGVLIGVFIISLILIISGGLRKGITNQISGLNNNILIVRSAQANSTGMEAFSPLTVAPITTLNSRDAQSLAKIDGVKDLTPMMFLSGRVSSENEDYSQITTIATSANFREVFDLKMADGDWFSDSEITKNWVILGDKLARGLLGTADAVGQVINIKGQNFTVVGILKRVNQPVSLVGADIDKTAFISLTNGLRFSGGADQIGQIAIRAKATDLRSTDKLSEAIRETLTKNHVDRDEFSVQAGGEATETLSGWLDTITVAALIFAGVSLVVGGVGIMNIMLVSVTERIHEIGIRKAVGATRRNILHQFLLEALLMTIYGGVFGLILAYGAGYLITLQFSLPLSFDWWIFAIGLGVPLVVGLLFGIWPAARAARQDPIVALKQLG